MKTVQELITALQALVDVDPAMADYHIVCSWDYTDEFRGVDKVYAPPVLLEGWILGPVVLVALTTESILASAKTGQWPPQVTTSS